MCRPLDMLLRPAEALSVKMCTDRCAHMCRNTCEDACDDVSIQMYRDVYMEMRHRHA